MSIEKKKILIVGGGPAGLMTALSLSKYPVDITLIDKSNWPIDKVCGEGIMPSGVEILKKYGIDKYLDQEQFREFSGISYVDSSSANGFFASGPGWLVRRTVLSSALYKAVTDTTAVKLLAETKLESWIEKEAKISVQTTNLKTSTAASLGEFDLMIACDGLRSPIRKKAGIEQIISKNQGRMGARVHYEISPWSRQVEVHWKNGIECYVAPVADGCVEFVFGWDQQKLKLRSGKGEMLENQLFSFFPEFQSKIKQQKKLSSLEAMGSFGRKALTPVSGQIVFLGDALVFLDPITGEGMSLAFEQADILARYYPAIFSTEGRQAYVSEIQKLTKRYLFMTNMALMLGSSALLRKALIYLFRIYPALFAHMLEVNMGYRKLIGNNLYTLVCKFCAATLHGRKFMAKTSAILLNSILSLIESFHV